MQIDQRRGAIPCSAVPSLAKKSTPLTTHKPGLTSTREHSVCFAAAEPRIFIFGAASDPICRGTSHRH